MYIVARIHLVASVVLRKPEKTMESDQSDQQRKMAQSDLHIEGQLHACD